MVDRHEAVERAEELLREFDLDVEGWVVKLDARATQRFGRCTRLIRRTAWGVEEIREIGLSTKLVELNGWDQVEDTIRHEIAHALAPPSAGHDTVWKSWCEVTGADPTRCYDSDEVETPPPRWLLTCSQCDVRIFRDRVPKRRGPLGHKGCKGVLAKHRNPLTNPERLVESTVAV